MNVVLIDVDHTISNAAWRDSMIGGDGGWDAYHAASIHDKPHDHMPDFIRLLALHWNVQALTARPGKWQQLTLKWFLMHDITGISDIIMRADDNYRPAPQLKLEIVKAKFKEPHKEIAFVIDDRLDVIEAFQGIGVPGFLAFSMRGLIK